MKTKKNILFFSALIVFSMILIVWIQMKHDSNMDSETVSYFNDGWNYTSESGRTITYSLPTKINLEHNHEYSITNTLPYSIQEGEILCIRTSQQRIKVEINHHIIYEYGQHKNQFFSDSSGSRWNFISIPADSSGQNIRITLSTPYQLYSGYVNSIIYGKESTILFHLINQYALHIFLSSVIFIFGVVGICFYHFSGIKRMGSQLLYLSLFAINISLWLFRESKLLQFVIENQELIETISYLGFLLFPIPLFSYIESSYTSIRKKVYPYIFHYLSFYCFISILLHMFHLIDLFITIHVSLLNLIGISTLVIIILLRELMVYKNRDVIKTLLPLCELMLFGLYEIIHYMKGSDTDSSTIFLFGLIIYIFLYGINSIQSFRITFQRARETKYYQKLAFTDLLTGAFNRTAYSKEIEEKFNQPSNCHNLRLIIFDLNNLKYINDNFGHIVGDKAIREAYYCIKEAFGKYGSCYRIGGDEFICIIPHLSEPKFNQSCNYFKELIQQRKQETIYPFDVAFGYSLFDEVQDTTFNDLIVRVDHLMYKNKKQIKISNLQH